MDSIPTSQNHQFLRLSGNRNHLGGLGNARGFNLGGLLLGTVGLVLPLLQTSSHTGQDVSTIVDSIVEVVVTTDGDERGAEVNIVEDRVDDSLVRTDKSGRGSAGVGGCHGRVPQSAVLNLALLGNVQQTLGANVLRGAIAGGKLANLRRSVALEGVKGSVSLGPSELLSLGDDGSEGDPDARAVLAASLLSLGVDAVDLLLGLLEGLTPETEDVGESTTSAVGGVRRSTDRDVDVAVDRADVAAEVLELVVLAIPVKGLSRGPGTAENLDVLLLTLISLLLVVEVTLTGLLSIVATGDEVDNNSALAELVKSSQGLGGNSRVDGVGAESDDNLDLLGHSEDSSANGEGVEGGGVVRDESVVELMIIQRPGIADEVLGVDASTGNGVQLRRGVGEGHADKLGRRSHFD